MEDKFLGFATPWIVYAIITFLHYFLPGKWVDGYVKDPETGKPLRYRLNGRLVLILCIAIWYALGYFDILSWGWFYEVRWWSLAGAFTIGILFTLWIVLPHSPVRKNILADLFLGRLENPQYKKGHIDAKMWLYLVGAILLELHVLSFAAHHYYLFGEAFNPGVFLCTGMITYFVFDYLSFEKVHLWTYDFFAERVGFKLGWGCIIFYPYFYSIAVWAAVEKANPGLEIWQMILYGLIFLSGWSLARGANMQKFFFKTQPEKKFLGIQPETITDGKKTLLVNGFWGLSRHINYLGEVLMGTGIALAAGFPSMIWPWLYPLYYVLLLFPRQMDDDKRCEKKYGPLWKEYTQKVKYRIIPFIY